jgi:hypothetical protein
VTPVDRAEILDYVSYEEVRSRILDEVMAQKRSRRVHLGEHLTFLFENHETVRFQIQEMIRVERIVKEADIRHEVDTYNELLGAEGELGATLLIEIDDPSARERLLRQWKTLPRHLYLELPGGEKVYATFDERQVGEDRLSSVQYLKFATSGRVPVAIGSDHPAAPARALLTEEQRRALASDLAD